jgi:hypothetical protein
MQNNSQVQGAEDASVHPQWGNREKRAMMNHYIEHTIMPTCMTILDIAATDKGACFVPSVSAHPIDDKNAIGGLLALKLVEVQCRRCSTSPVFSKYKIYVERGVDQESHFAFNYEEYHTTERLKNLLRDFGEVGLKRRLQSFYRQEFGYFKL